MITRSGLFADLMCPYEEDCNRPNCHYWHSAETATTSSSTFAVPKEEAFLGYVGYVGTTTTTTPNLPSNDYAFIINSNSQSKTLNSRFQENNLAQQRATGMMSKRLQKKLGLIHEPLSKSRLIPVRELLEPGPSTNSFRVASLGVNNRQVSKPLEQSLGEYSRAGLSKMSRPCKDLDADEIEERLATIDTTIEELKKKMERKEKEKKKLIKEIELEDRHITNGIKSDYIPTKKSLLEAESKRTSISSSGYTPTPISVLNSVKKEKVGKEKVTKKLEESLALPKKENVPTCSKYQAKKKDSSLSIEDLFDENDEKPPQKKPKLCLSKSTVSIAKTSAPAGSAKSTVSVGPVKSALPAAPVKNTFYADAIKSTPTRIGAALRQDVNRVNTVLKRIPNPNQQLSIRYANLQKEKEELMKKAEKYSKAGTVSTSETAAKTSASTVEKGSSRTAHKVNDAATKKLLLLDAFKPCKVASAIRYKYLQLFYDEFLKITNSTKEAITLAQNEEKKIKDRAHNKVVYSCSAVNTLKNLRKGDLTSNTGLKTVSHSATLAGRHNGTFSVSNRSIVKPKSMMSEREFYVALAASYLMSKDQLIENGFPCWENEEKLAVKIPPSSLKPKTIVGNNCPKRVCSRCGKEFLIKSNGEYAVDDQCVYHWGRCYKERRTQVGKYVCCNGTINDSGCCIADNHVTDALPQSALSTFISTPSPEATDDPRSVRVFAMDCEMVYTICGLALARVSVVDVNDELVLDILVRQTDRVIDYNTHFSGLTKQQLESAECDLEQARKRLFSLVNCETILIGHGLENDLIALRMVHDRIVDTSVVFPHRLGQNMKSALRTLAYRELNLIIQANEEGHDSKEDSSTCMKLMQHKVKQSL